MDIFIFLMEQLSAIEINRDENMIFSVEHTPLGLSRGIIYSCVY